MANIKPIGSEKLEGMDKIKRIMEIARYKENLPQNINEKRYSLLGNKIYKSSNKTNSILNDIISCSLCGHLKKMYLEYKCMELLLVQFEQQLNLDKKEYSLKNRYIQKMFDKFLNFHQKNLNEMSQNHSELLDHYFH